MSLDAFPTRDTQPGTRHHQVRILGTGAANPTKQLGLGVTVTWVATGRYLYTWADHPGTFVGFTPGFQAATPADLKGYTVVADTWDSTNKQLEFSVFNSSFAAADLAANQYLYLDIVFKATTV